MALASLCVCVCVGGGGGGSFSCCQNSSDALRNGLHKTSKCPVVSGTKGLAQGWGTLILEGHSPAEFSSNPEKTWKTNTSRHSEDLD